MKKTTGRTTGPNSNKKMEEEIDTTDIYLEETAEELLDGDCISPEEAAFMQGYEQESVEEVEAA